MQFLKALEEAIGAPPLELNCGVGACALFSLAYEGVHLLLNVDMASSSSKFPEEPPLMLLSNVR